MYCVEMNGKLRFEKKYEHQPSCFHCPRRSPSEGIRTLVATHRTQLLVYSDTTLLWAANLNCVPACLKVATLM